MESPRAPLLLLLLLQLILQKSCPTGLRIEGKYGGCILRAMSPPVPLTLPPWSRSEASIASMLVFCCAGGVAHADALFSVAVRPESFTRVSPSCSLLIAKLGLLLRTQFGMVTVCLCDCAGSGSEAGTTEGGFQNLFLTALQRSRSIAEHQPLPAAVTGCVTVGIVRLGQKREEEEEECNLHLNVGQDTAQGAD